MSRTGMTGTSGRCVFEAVFRSGYTPYNPDSGCRSSAFLPAHLAMRMGFSGVSL